MYKDSGQHEADTNMKMVPDKTPLRPAPSMLLNGSHPIVFVLHQPHITGSFYSKYFMQAETLSDKLLVQSSSSVSIFGEDTSLIVPSEGTASAKRLPTLVDSSHVVPSCEIHNDVQDCDIPGTIAMYYDGDICNVNSLKSSSENCWALCKQECKEVIPLTSINNTEYETSQHQGVAGITVDGGGDAIVPDIDHSEKSSLTDDRLKDGTTPAVLLEAGSMAALNTYPLNNQDSSSPPDINGSDSHFVQYCFAAKKESLLNEESDYELELLSPTQESHRLQASIVDCSQCSASSVTASGGDHIVLVRSPQYVTATSSQNIHTLHYSETAGDGSTTVDQALPAETAKQPRMRLVCHKDTVNNTDDDFEDNSESTLIIVDPELQNQQNCNNSYDPGKIFPRDNDDNIVDQSPHIGNHLVPSIDLSDDDDGPSCLLRAMETVERKDHHVKRQHTTWERILFTGNYYDTVSTTRLNLSKPKLRLGLSRNDRCRSLHPYYRAGTH